MEPIMKAYIQYDNTPEIRAILLKEEYATGNRLIIGNRIIESERPLPRELVLDMITHKGARIEEYKVPIYVGKQKIFNEPHTYTKTKSVKGKKFIIVSIRDDLLQGLMLKISHIKSEMLEYDIEPKVCIWGQIGKLNTREYTEEEIKKMPEFSKDTLVEQRYKELETMREGY